MSRSIVSHHQPHNNYLSYAVGYLLSLLITFGAYLLAVEFKLDAHLTWYLVSGLAVVQFLVQMVFFLHIGNEVRPRWKLMVLLFMIGIVLILVTGSIWIMNNLNYNMMQSPGQTNQYLHDQDRL